MDEVVVATFPYHPGLQSKLGETLRQEYTTSLQLSLARPYGDSRAVELFLKHWMGDSLRRAWVSLVARLFRNVVSPFGNQVAFSCIPIQLTDLSGGPPPENGHMSEQWLNKFQLREGGNKGGEWKTE